MFSYVMMDVTLVIRDIHILLAPQMESNSLGISSSFSETSRNPYLVYGFLINNNRYKKYLK